MRGPGNAGTAGTVARHTVGCPRRLLDLTLYLFRFLNLSQTVPAPTGVF